jgi:hypothetical protein
MVRERRGHLSVVSDVAAGEPLVRVPEALLVPVETTTWHVDGDTLSIDRHDRTASALQRELAALLVEVYNATGKVEWARSTLPTIALGDVPEAMHMIRVLRPSVGEQWQDLATALIDTRAIRLPSARCEGDRLRKGRRVLMPLIDLLDHHRHGAPYMVTEGLVSISAAHPTGNSACFARYGPRRDPVDLALAYGFADQTAVFARSIAAELDVPGVGPVRVEGRRPPPRSSLDPPMMSVQSGRLSLSHLTFHQEHPARLFTVVRMAFMAHLSQSRDSRSDPDDLVRAFLNALGSVNTRTLRSAEAALSRSDAPAAAMLKAALRKQRSVIARSLSGLGIPSSSAQDEPMYLIDAGWPGPIESGLR